MGVGAVGGGGGQKSTLSIVSQELYELFKFNFLKKE